MNHPKQEEWAPYLYGEANAETRRRLKAHLRGCAECREEIEGWQLSRDRLAAWKVPSRVAPTERFMPVLKWAAVAALLLMPGLGFELGRLTVRPPDLQKLRAAIEPGIRQELRQEFAGMLHEQIEAASLATLAASSEETKSLLSDYAQFVEARRAEDSQAIYAALRRLDANYASLTKDLDIVAVNTDASFRSTERELVELVADPHGGHNPSVPQK